MLLVSEEARFVDSYVAVGITPGWGLSQRLSRAVGLQRANETSLSGRALTAHEAVASGLASRLYTAADLLPDAIALAETIGARNPAAVSRMKRVIADGWRLPLGEALMQENAAARRANLNIDPASVAAGFDRVRG